MFGEGISYAGDVDVWEREVVAVLGDQDEGQWQPTASVSTETLRDTDLPKGVRHGRSL